MTIFQFLLALVAFSAAGVLSQEYDSYDSAKLEAEEFVNELFDDHLHQFLPESETRLDDFSCHIPKELLYGFILTHRDIRATFTNGVASGLSNVTKLQCRPAMEESDGRTTMVCLIELKLLNVGYSGDVTGFDLMGTHSKSSVRTRAKHVLSVSFSQKRPAPPTVDELHSMIARNMELELGNFGFNKARQGRLRACVDRNIRERLLDAITANVQPAIKKALLTNNRDLPEPRLQGSDFAPDS